MLHPLADSEDFITVSQSVIGYFLVKFIIKLLLHLLSIIDFWGPPFEIALKIIVFRFRKMDPINKIQHTVLKDDQ